MKPLRVFPLGMFFLLAVSGSLLASGPVLSASFENSTEIAGAADAKVVGKLTFEESPCGVGATFDGSAWIEVPDSAALRPAQWTICAWVAPQQSECGGRIIEKGASNSFWLLFYRGKARCGFWNAETGYQEVDSSTVFQPNEWRFVAGIFDGDSLRLYVDGQLESFMKTQGAPKKNKHPLVIGAKHQGIAGDRLIGAMDEVAFYDRALAEPEIQALFARGR